MHPPAGCLAGRGVAPNIGDGVNDPSIELVLGLCSFGARFNQRFDQIKQRQVHLGKVGDLGRPVVHLDVHVGVIIAIPGRLNFIRPNPLQVSWQGSGARG